MLKRRDYTAILSALAALFLISSASAQLLEVTDVTVNPSVVWLSDSSQITVSGKCRYNGSVVQADDARVEVRSPTGLTTTENLRYSSGTYSATFALYGFSEIGTYTASVTCDYSGQTKTASKYFTVRNMELSILTEGTTLNAYMGEVLELKVDFRVDGNIVSLAKDDYEIEIGGEEVEAISVIGTSSYQKLNVDLCPSGDLEECMDDLPEGTYDLEVTANYASGRSITAKVKNYVKVNPPMKIDFDDSVVECVVGAYCTPSISFDVEMTSGSAADIDKEDITARLLGNKVFKSSLNVEDLQCDKQSGACTVKINIPSDLQPGLYDLFIGIEKEIGDDYYLVEEPIDLKVVLRLSGLMLDAAGEVKSATISLTDMGTGQVISGSTDYAGRYSIDLLPSDYSLETRFGGAIMRFTNVSLSSDDFLLGMSGNIIRFDEGHLNSGAPGGVRVVRVVAVELALPFSSAWFYLAYDSAAVNGDENNLKVYKCDKWNFEKGFCNGDWVQVPADVHTIRNAVEFSTDSTSAFIIGEQRALYLRNLELESDSVYIGDTVVMAGKVFDSDGRDVEGAEVRLSFPDFGITSSTSTTTGGYFQATITAPYTTGYPNLYIEASKSSYASASAITTLNVEKKKALSVFGLPESIDLKFNEPQKVSFKVFNSGQINLSEEIFVKVSGIPASWYKVSTTRISGLGVSEGVDVDLNLSVTRELCAGGCDQYSLVTIGASSDEVSASSAFTLALTSQEEQSSQSGATTGGGLEMPNITGFSISMPSMGSPYLAITVIIILSILIVNKKKASGVTVKKPKSRKSGKGSPKLRDNVMISLGNIKKEI